MTRLGGKWRGRSLRDAYFVRWFFSSLGLGVFLFAAILALAGFPGQVRRESYSAEGWDTIFLLDISRSMWAQDLAPTRLAWGGALIRAVTDRLDTGRFGLVVFRGAAAKLFPLSEDREGLAGFTAALTPDLVTTPGTGLAAGLQTAAESFLDGRETRRRIILITDGGDAGQAPSETRLRALANLLRDKNILLTIVGAGGTADAEIPLPGGGRVADAAGRPVLTRLNAPGLTRLAELCGGRYYEARDPRLLTSLREDYAPAAPAGYIEASGDGYRPFLLIALAGLAFCLWARIKPWKF